MTVVSYHWSRSAVKRPSLQHPEFPRLRFPANHPPMFDFAWSEIALIAIVALVAIGPKDLPVAFRAVTRMIQKARRMRGQFQTHVDEMVREANLDEVRSQISQIRNFDFRGEVERTVHPDGSIRTTLASNPLGPNPLAPQPLITPPPLPEQAFGDSALARQRMRAGTGAPGGAGLHPAQHGATAAQARRDGTRARAAGFHSASGRAATPSRPLGLIPRQTDS